MKKRLTYHLDIIGHYLLVGWLLFIAITIMVSLLTYIVMDANPTFIHQIVTGLSDKFAEPKDNLHAFWMILLNNERVALGLMLISMKKSLRLKHWRKLDARKVLPRRRLFARQVPRRRKPFA